MSIEEKKSDWGNQLSHQQPDRGYRSSREHPEVDRSSSRELSGIDRTASRELSGIDRTASHLSSINPTASAEHSGIDRSASREHSGIDRREFLKIFGGGIAVLCVSGGGAVLASQQSADAVALTTDQIGAWLHIGEDGSITVFTGKVEVGQNIRTSLAQAVAEELRSPVESVNMVMGDTDLTPYDRGTFGSRTTPEMNPELRRAAAAAREMLLDLAAEAWQVDRTKLRIADGAVTDSTTSGRSLHFGELTRGQRLIATIADDTPLTPVEEWMVTGTSVPKTDGRAFVTGRHQFVSDLSIPGMVYGKVLRPPAFGATLTSLDPSGAERIPGADVVRDGNFVGVAAPDVPSAEHAREALRAEWTAADGPSDMEIFEYLKAHPSEARGWGGRSEHTDGDVESGLANAHTRLDETYTVAYIAHVPMEPRAAVAEWTGDKLTVWTGTQRPFGVREELMDAFGLSETQVRVIMPDTGSAYGGKHTGDAAVEAARLARAAGAPVKLVWTRDEEFTWAYFRPAGVIEIASGLDREGRIAAWSFDNYNSGGSAIRTPYSIAHQRIRFHPAESPLRQGSYRALAATANNFARESHMDVLAHIAGTDPLTFRLAHLDDDRLRAVLEAAAEAFEWGSPAQHEGHGLGIAAGIEKGGYVATCAEVAVNPTTREVRVVRVTEAFECGAVVNPEHLKNQIEGCIIQGLGGALFEAVTFEHGRITNAALSGYRVPRFSDAPEIEVVLVDRKDLPSAGAGETPIIGIAPAVANALFEASAVRVHSLPMAPNGLDT